ncbi:ABC transporter substrate-binding protein [Peptoniphilus sp. SGI.035]|uniref:ABC transporter substrate-binding protein n=1 Tax=Peptoniphilus sp. SGI.035 TaxID=3420564 RepID=UPI003CFE672C
MKKITKKLSLILVLTIILGLFSSCNKEESSEVNNKEDVVTNETKEAKKEGKHKIIDHAGNEVEVPNNIERIVIDQIPILSTYTAYHGGKAPYIVGYAGSLKEVISDTVLKEMAPELLKAENTVHAQSDINIEEIMKLKPDVIFYNAQNKEHFEQLSKTGIPCVGFATVGAKTPADPINRYVEWLKLLEDVFEEKGKMDNFVDAGNNIVKDVEQRIAKVPENERPSAMILWKYVQGTPIVAGKGVFGDFWLRRLGVKNVAGEAKGFAKINVEQIYEWNPDILFLDGPGLLDIKTKDVFDNNVKGIDFSNLNSVKNRRVYNTKLGMWNWFTPNPDGPLVLAWLAKSTYPEYFKDYDLNKIIKEYYSKWYNYNLNDKEIEDMFSI